ncbi:MAG TPA: hypothetical protein GXZ60_06200 [Intrasporangiaceae bacterium]|nr:hypothetical protein [Intrasporangiaceae bacterium]
MNAPEPAPPADRPIWMWVVIAVGLLASIRPLYVSVVMLAQGVRDRGTDLEGLASGIGGLILVAVLPALGLWALWIWRDREWMFAVGLAWLVIGLGLMSLAGFGPIGPMR